MKRTKILFEGHDLKFLSHIIGHYQNLRQYHVDVFTYEGHIIKDLKEINRILPEIDIIFCEWGLGNLQWFSQNKLPGQRIVTRVHLQEFFTPFLAETNWDYVDRIIVVGPFMKEKFDRLFPAVSEKCIVIPNVIDTKSFDLPKEDESWYNLGLLGILPRRKAPHLALEILQQLRNSDKRYKLFIKGRRPEEVDWLWRKPEEQAYYNDFFSKIQRLGLKDAVVFESQGNDVQRWFQRIGFVISPSEFESFHMAIAEGMASRAIPVIRNWEGADKLFPVKYIFDKMDEAVAMIRKFSLPAAFKEEGLLARQYCEERYDVSVILPEYDKIMLPDLDIARIRREFIQATELRKRLAADLEISEKTNEKLASDLSSLVEQQKSLINTQSALTGEIALEKSDLARYREANQKYYVTLGQIEQEIKSVRESLDHRMLEISRINDELQEQRTENAVLKVEVSRKHDENQKLKEVHAGELTHTKLLFETRLSMTNDSFETQRRDFIDERKRLVEEKRLLEKEKEILRHEIMEKNTELAKVRFQREEERFTFLARIDRLNAINLDLERRLMQTFSSMSWKVGALLIKKPLEIMDRLKRSLFSAKKAS